MKKQKKRKRKKCKAKSIAAKKRPRVKAGNTFAASAKLSDSELLTRLLKQDLRKVPARIPLSVMVVRTIPNKKRLRWSTIIINNLLHVATAGKSPEALKAISILFDRTEGKVPETLRHGLDEYSSKIVEAIKEIIYEKTKT